MNPQERALQRLGIGIAQDDMRIIKEAYITLCSILQPVSPSMPKPLVEWELACLENAYTGQILNGKMPPIQKVTIPRTAAEHARVS